MLPNSSFALSLLMLHLVDSRNRIVPRDGAKDATLHAYERPRDILNIGLGTFEPVGLELLSQLDVSQSPRAQQRAAHIALHVRC